MSSKLLSRIENLYPTLSKSHKKVAKYILEDYDKAAFMTAATLGKTVDISESTVVRFATGLWWLSRVAKNTSRNDKKQAYRSSKNGSHKR